MCLSQHVTEDISSQKHNDRDDNAGVQDSALKAESQEQVLQLFSAGACNGKILDNEAQDGGVSLGLGSARMIADFQETVGVDYRRMQISAAAMRGSRGADVEYASESSQTDLAPHLALVLQCKQP